MEKQPDTKYEVTPVGVVRSCFREKFGIPRQPGLVRAAEAVIELLPPFNREEMVRGLEGFSHLQLLFLFHGAMTEGWKPTVRPPRLGGKQRVGVFASRSPHRPNHIGLSAVRLEAVERKEGLCLRVSGVDLLDGTPVVDIKPYVPYSDAVASATEGFTAWEDEGGGALEVGFSDQAEAFCEAYASTTGRRLLPLVQELLQRDPRPRSQRERKKEYGMTLWDVNIRWHAEAGKVLVSSMERL